MGGDFCIILEPSEPNLKVQTLSSNPKLLLISLSDVSLIPSGLEGT